MDRRWLSGELRRSQRDRHRMAGEGRHMAASGGRGNRDADRGRRARDDADLELARGAEVPRAARARLRFFARFLLVFLAVLGAPAFAAETLLSSRVWPAQEYTRVTLE